MPWIWKKVGDIPRHAQHEKMEVLKIKGGCKEGTQMIAMVWLLLDLKGRSILFLKELKSIKMEEFMKYS